MATSNDIKNVLRKNEMWAVLFSLPKTLFFNFRYLPLKKAIKLPIWIYYKCKYDINGEIILPIQIKTAMIRIGFSVDYAKDFHDMTYFRVEEDAICKFDGTAHIGRGSKITVRNGALLEIGDNFAISASSTIKCFKHIQFGRDILFAWDCLVMDSDGHRIYDEQNTQINDDSDILFGDKIWIGCGVTILKGVQIPNNCVIGARTIITQGFFTSNSIIVGNPPSSKKQIRKWEI